MFKYLSFALLLILSFSSCKKDNTDDTLYFNTIAAQVQTSNSLRVDVEVSLVQSSSCYIEYWKETDGTKISKTKEVNTGSSAKFTLVLLEAATKYQYRVVANTPSGKVESTAYSFTTGKLPSDLELLKCRVKSNELKDELGGYILRSQRSDPGYIMILNTMGEILWYNKMNKQVWIATFDSLTNTISCIIGEDKNQIWAGEEIRVVDLLGNILFTKSTPERPPHHDVRRLPNGNLLVVNFVPRAFDLTSRGGTANEIVVGDGYTIYDMQGNIVEQWDCFDTLNPADDPEVMAHLNDWLHVNSINYDPQGNFYLTPNMRNELWKIDTKTKKVVYRLGIDGNVKVDPNGFCFGLHSVEPIDGTRVLVLDNGYTQKRTRALVYSVDEKNLTATVEQATVFPSLYHSPYMSNAQFISDKLMIYGSTMSNSALITDYDGNVLRILFSDKYQSYRSLYIPEISPLY